MQLASRLGQQQDMSIFSYLQELFKIKQEEILFFLMIYIKKKINLVKKNPVSTAGYQVLKRGVATLICGKLS